jgi:hypothetical protein
MFQLFKFADTIVYVDGELSEVAKRLIEKYYSSESKQYIGQTSSLRYIYEEYDDYFIDGYSNETYKKFLKIKK